MGLLSDIFAVKEEIWRGGDMELCEKLCGTLKENGYFFQKIKINQEAPTCDGNCAGCAAMKEVDENEPFYKKIGVGCSSDLLGKKEDYEIYAVYVKKAEEEKIRQLLAIG